MRLLRGLAWVSTLTLLDLPLGPLGVQAQSPSQYPLHDNGLNKVVQWDHYSFKINGQRLFVFSGELHYWRIPVPEVWEDILEKIKAAGFTACMIPFRAYTHTHPCLQNADHRISQLLSMAIGAGIVRITRH